MNILFPGEHQLDFKACDLGNLFLGEKIIGIRGGNGQDIVDFEHGNHIELNGFLLGQHMDDGRVHQSLSDPDMGNTQLLTQDLIQFLCCQNVLFNQDIAQAVSGLLLDLEHIVQPLRSQLSLENQHLSKLHALGNNLFFYGHGIRVSLGVMRYRRLLKGW